MASILPGAKEGCLQFEETLRGLPICPSNAKAQPSRTNQSIYSERRIFTSVRAFDFGSTSFF